MNRILILISIILLFFISIGITSDIWFKSKPIIGKEFSKKYNNTLIPNTTIRCVF